MQAVSGAKRLDWVDLAKATCILLVVVYHARHLTYLIDWQHKAEVSEAWEAFSTLLKPLRMPLFFLVSGVLAASSLHREWREVAPRRVFNLYYVYTLWGLIFLLLLPPFPFTGGGAELPLAAKVSGVTAGVSLAWYLWALPTYFCLARATRDLPLWAPFSFALALALLAMLMEPLLPVQQTSMLRCLIFFIAGIRLPELVHTIAAQATPRRFIAAALCFAVALLVSLSLGSSFNPVVDTAAVLTGIIAACLAAARWPHIMPVARWFSARTLPIYLLHFPLLVAVPPLAALILPEILRQSFAFALFFPLIAATASVAISLAFYSIAPRCGLDWLFELPKRRRARVEAVAG